MTICYSFLGLLLQGVIVSILFATTPVAGQDLNEIKLTINASNISLEKTFRLIEEKTNFRFVYFDKEVPLQEKVMLSAKDVSLSWVLEELARECNLSFKRVNNQIVVKKDGHIQPPEKYILSGIVFDVNTQEPIPYSNIFIKDINKGMPTDEKGNFKFTLESGNYELQVSYIGYKTEQIGIKIEKKELFIQIPLVRTDVLLQEVSVYSKSVDTVASQSVSSVTLQSKRIEQISGILPDVFRSIQMLPGIAVNNEYSAKFNVRGGNYDENLVLINGTQVYEPFHLKEAANASVGIFNINLMSNVEMITGGFSAMYGDRLSSVLNIDYREGSHDKYKSSASISLTNLDAMTEGPITSNSSYLLAVRKSYLEYVLSMVGSETQAKPSFYDVQGILSYSVSPANKFLFKFIHSGDDFTNYPGINSYGPTNLSGTFKGYPATQKTMYYSYEGNYGTYYNNLFDVQNVMVLSGQAILKGTLSFYEQYDNYHRMDSTYYITNINSNKNYFYFSHYRNNYDNNLKIKTWEGKISFDGQVSPFYEIRTGFNYQNISYAQDLFNLWNTIATQNIDAYPNNLYQTYSNQPIDYSGEKINASSYKLAGYIENVFQINENIILNAGGRVDYFDINKDLNFSPRLSISYKTDFGSIIRAAWGYYYQSPIYDQLKYATPSDTNTKAQKATHYILGIENFVYLDETNTTKLTIKTEGFYKKYDNLISSTTDSYGRITYSRINDSEGYAAGCDFYTTLSLPGFYGWFCYEYLVSKEDYLNNPSKVYPRYTDQTHTLSFVADFDLGYKWDFNLRASYGSGFAFTPSINTYDKTTLSYKYVIGEKNSARIPPYKRIDVRISKELTVWSLKADLFLDVSNLFNFENVQGYNYRYDNNGNPMTEEIKLWPIIPTIGFTVHF